MATAVFSNSFCSVILYSPVKGESKALFRYILLAAFVQLFIIPLEFLGIAADKMSRSYLGPLRFIRAVVVALRIIRDQLFASLSLDRKSVV